MTRLWVIILHWNKYEDTRDCVRLLLQNRIENAQTQLLVIDNGSSQQACNQLRQDFRDKIELLRTDRNLGCAGGNNLGIQHALAQGADLILLLNNDTTMSADFLSNFVNATERHPEADIFGCKIFYQQRPDRLWFAGGSINAWLGNTSHFGFNQPDNPKFQKEREVSFITGCAMLIRAVVFSKIGLLDESLFLYYEDVDFCQRAQRAGVKLLFTPQAALQHKVGAGVGQNLTPAYLYYQMRNRYRVLQRGRSFAFRGWLLMLHLTVYCGFRMLYVASCGGSDRWRQMQAIWQGCRDSFATGANRHPAVVR